MQHCRFTYTRILQRELKLFYNASIGDVYIYFGGRHMKYFSRHHQALYNRQKKNTLITRIKDTKITKRRINYNVPLYKVQLR